MTNKKAIDLLDNLIGMVDDNHDSDYDTALKMAIKALDQEPCNDAISRQAVLDNSWELEYPDSSSEEVVSVKDIKALPPVNPQNNLLDKIRAEIENDWQLRDFPASPFSCGLRHAIEIIDKYKSEREDKGNE